MTHPSPVPRSPSSFADRLESILRSGAIIVLAGLFVFAPSFRGGWLIDDNFEVTENSFIQSPSGLPAIWQGEAGADYLPIKSTLQWLLWHTWGNQPLAFRLTSLALHLASALLFWRLLWRLGVRHAWTGGLLLAIHPLLVETVAWPAEIKNTLSLALLLPAMLAWVRFDAHHRRRDYFWALGCFVAALLSKSSVIALPAVILLHAWWRRGRIGRADVIATLPFAAVSLASAIATVQLQAHRAIGTEVFPVGGFASRLALTGTNLAFYVGKTLWPAHLLPIYPQWRVEPPTWPEFLPWPLLAALLWVCWRRRGTWGRPVLLGLGFFLFNVAPVLGFFPMSYWRLAWASDHLAYLPSLGLLGLAAAAAGSLYERLGARWRGVALVGGWLAVAALIFSAHLDAAVYTNVVAESEYTLAGNPDAWLAHQLLANACQARHDYPGALAHARAACRLHPDVAEVQNTLGTALELNGQLREAIEPLRAAVRLAPSVWPIHINLARCLAGVGQYEESLREYRFLLEHQPNNPVFLCNTGFCLFKLGNVDDAIACFRKALEIDPNLRDARDSLEIALKRRSGIGGF